MKGAELEQFRTEKSTSMLIKICNLSPAIKIGKVLDRQWPVCYLDACRFSAVKYAMYFHFHFHIFRNELEQFRSEKSTSMV